MQAAFNRLSAVSVWVKSRYTRHHPVDSVFLGAQKYLESLDKLVHKIEAGNICYNLQSVRFASVRIVKW